MAATTREATTTATSTTETQAAAATTTKENVPNAQERADQANTFHLTGVVRERLLLQMSIAVRSRTRTAILVP